MNRKPGDWNCRSCQHLNFSRRDMCQRCGDPRSGGDFGANFGGGRGMSSFGGGGGFGGSDVRPGDWYCNCGAHNFASRSSCFKCGAFKEDSAINGGFDADMPRARGLGLATASVGAVQGGNLVTGFAPDLVAMSTTLLAGWSALGATPQENLVLKSKEKTERI